MQSSNWDTAENISSEERARRLMQSVLNNHLSIAGTVASPEEITRLKEKATQRVSNIDVLAQNYYRVLSRKPEWSNRSEEEKIKFAYSLAKEERDFTMRQI